MTVKNTLKNQQRYDLLTTDYVEQKAHLFRYGKYIIMIWVFIILCFIFNLFQSFAYALMLNIVAINFYQIIKFFYTYHQLKSIKKKIMLSTDYQDSLQLDAHLTPLASQELHYVSHKTRQLNALSSEILKDRDEILLIVRLRHRRQINEIYNILNEVILQKTTLNLTKHQQVKTEKIQKETFLNLKNIIHEYSNCPATERFRFQSDVNYIPDVWLSQQLNILLENLLHNIKFLYQHDLNLFLEHQKFLQQQVTAQSSFQIHRE